MDIQKSTNYQKKNCIKNWMVGFLHLAIFSLSFIFFYYSVVYSKIEGSTLKITESDQFDLLFSCLLKFSSISSASKSSIIVTLESGLKGMVKKLSDLLKKSADQYRQQATAYRNALKMYLYLLNWFIHEEEKITQEQPTGRVRKSAIYFLYSFY